MPKNLRRGSRVMDNCIDWNRLFAIIQIENCVQGLSQLTQFSIKYYFQIYVAIRILKGGIQELKEESMFCLYQGFSRHVLCQRSNKKCFCQRGQIRYGMLYHH